MAGELAWKFRLDFKLISILTAATVSSRFTVPSLSLGPEALRQTLMKVKTHMPEERRKELYQDLQRYKEPKQCPVAALNMKC